LRVLKIKIAFAIVTLLVLGNIYSQDLSFQNKFKELNIENRLEFYDTLNDSIKKSHTNFLKEEFEKLDSVTDNELISRHIKMAISQLNYYSNNYINSINILNAVLANKKSVLAATDSLSIYDNLKKSYYKLYLYPEIFEANSKIKELIKNGTPYPLWSYNMNSKLYGNLNQFDKAIVALKKEIEDLEKSKERDSLIIPSAYNDLGYYYFSSNKNDSALVNFKKSLSFAEQSLKQINNDSYQRITAVVKGNIAGIYVKRKMFKEAIPLLLEDISVGLRTKSNLTSTLYSYNLLVECYLKTNKIDKALETIKEAEVLIPTLLEYKIVYSSVVEYYKVKADYFSHIKKRDSSNYYLNKAFIVKDSIELKSKNQILASNELRYTLTEEHRLVEQYKIDLKNQELRLKNNQKNILILFAIGLSFLLFLSLFNSYKLKKSKKEIKEKNKQIREKNTEVNKALLEKEVLLKEVHHRVKNNLQVISGLLEMQNISVTDESVKLALKEGQNRIQSVALVHKMMYQSENVSKVNMAMYLEELLQVLQMSYGLSGKNIQTSIQVKDIDFDVTDAVPISLIVNEAVCNAYKHAFNSLSEGEIGVSIFKNAKNIYTLTIKDNGIGLPNGFDIKKLKSIGFDLIKGLTKQLKGTLEVNSVKGTEIKISFSNKENA